MPCSSESSLSEVKSHHSACSVAAELLDPREAAEHSSTACSVQARAELPKADTLVRVMVTSNCSKPLDLELQVMSALLCHSILSLMCYVRCPGRTMVPEASLASPPPPKLEKCCRIMCSVVTHLQLTDESWPFAVPASAASRLHLKSMVLFECIGANFASMHCAGCPKGC